ncbi:hypothetical protein [Paraburkholderia aromaticivorans]|uniref:Uncharacterized protein n=1 Tax=Paraburkholderia aromaticivorans TaxID=2026199 RepID=A0A248VKR6_9BURK|nr:hypothetical protein [Paraburkholderia aromaticivorans]ASV99009.1 hypothetical protein CJU94_13095 [Paraburkholderia aromaticivorans]
MTSPVLLYHIKAKANYAYAQEKLWKAVEQAYPIFAVTPPKKEVMFDECHKLSRVQIDTGVRAFAMACNLYGGSMGEVQLYRLLQIYLKDPAARARINEVIDESGA